MSASRPAKSFLPSTAVLEMTYRCSHSCLFCSCPWEAPDHPMLQLPEMDTEEWEACIAQLCRHGATSLAFTGGEPLLREDLGAIIAFAAAQSCEHVETAGDRLVTRHAPPRLYLLSNGDLVSDAVLALCLRYGVHLSMSLPGLTTFAEHTGAAGPERVLERFTRARELGVGTTVGITATARNIHELYETMGEALLAGAETVLLNRFLPGGRGLSHAEALSLSREQVAEMLLVAEEVLETANRHGSVGTELPKCVLPKRSFQRLAVGTRCGAATDFVVIDPSGHLRVCNHSPIRLPRWTDLEAVKSHPHWQRFTRKDYLPAPCAACSEATSCDGGCREAAHIAGGRPSALDPLLTGASLPTV